LKKSFIIVGQVLVIAVLIAGLLLISITTPVRAHSGDEVVAVFGTTPNVNGIIAAGEWADASTETFTVTDGGTCTIYVKQDGSHLYVAFDIPDTTYYVLEPLESDEGWVCLDVNHNGGGDIDDLWFEVLRDGTTVEYYWFFISRTPDGWTAACSETADGWQTEFSILYSKIGVTAGVEKTLGVMFETIDAYEYGTSYYSWPPDSYDDDPETWADLTSPSPWFWIPEIPSSLVAIALILAAVIAYPHMRKLYT